MPAALEPFPTVIGSWVDLHAQIIGHRAVMRACTATSGMALFVACFIRTAKEFSIFDADQEIVPTFLRRWLATKKSFI
jgi:hypothetical protein